MDYINVHPNDVIELNLEYYKDISKIYAIQIESLGNSRKETPIYIINNSIKVNNEKGQYAYSIKVMLDSTTESTNFVSM